MFPNPLNYLPRVPRLPAVPGTAGAGDSGAEIRRMGGWRAVFTIATLAWGLALTYSTLTGRALYADGALYVLVHLFTPNRFNDYDAQRSFASFMSQAPILFGQRLGVDTVSRYAALYSVGVFVFPAAAFLAALFLGRKQPLLFAANAVAIAVFGFGTNFINTEANLLFGLVWLAVTIMTLDRAAPLLRGFVLPIISFALLRVYEGMLLVGPIMCAYALLVAGWVTTDRERIGLTLSALLFLLGAVIGLGGFLSPRDPSNASGFLSSALLYLKNPQVFLFLAALLAFAATLLPARRLRLACAVLGAMSGAAFLVALARLEGYFSFSVYYYNRAFLVLSLPAFVGALFLANWLRPDWLRSRDANDGYAFLLIPLSCALAGDVFGTTRWSAYISEFCAVLEKRASPAERLAQLRQSGVRTGWAWTHPSMSVLLRDQGSQAMVTNDPGQYEPFDARKPVSIAYRGFCEAPVLGPARLDSFELPMTFGEGKYPSYVASVSGLSKPEGWATWSEGPIVEIRFARRLPQIFDLTLRIASAFGGNRGLPVRVRASASEQSFVVDREPFEVTIPFHVVGDATSLSFVIPRPESPLELGKGNDPRKLGIAFSSLVVVPR